jgi:hypothetical protein
MWLHCGNPRSARARNCRKIDGISRSEPAREAPSAEQLAEAQRTAALIGRQQNPNRLAEALARAHRRDALERMTGAATEAREPQHKAGRSDPASRAKAALSDLRREAEKDPEARRPEQDHVPERMRPRGRTR